MYKNLRRALILGSCLSMMGFLAGCNSDDIENDKSVPTLVSPIKQEIKTEKAVKGSIIKTGTISGKIVPAKTVDMYFKNKGGNLSKINVKVGDTVKKGDVLVELESTDITYSIKQEEIKLKMAELTYDQAKNNPNASEYDRQKAELAVESEKLQMEMLNNNLKNCILTSDISGKVMFVTDVKLTQYVNGFQTLVTVVDPKDYLVQCAENQDFKIGTKVNIKDKDKQFDGEVISNTSQVSGIDQAGKDAEKKVVVKFLNTDENIRLGDSVNVSCTIAKKDNILVIPFNAVMYGAGNHPYVQVSVNGDILEKYIETGIFNETSMEVTSGLSEGEQVVIN